MNEWMDGWMDDGLFELDSEGICCWRMNRIEKMMDGLFLSALYLLSYPILSRLSLACFALLSLSVYTCAVSDESVFETLATKWID